MARRIRILGGGAAGLAAAFELTATPELRAAHEVTVHQSGWRLGGKGASGRNAAAGQRIEEHGLHLWFGFYENAFSMIQAVYAELDRPAGAPLATWREAFEPLDDVVLHREDDDGWHHHTFNFPRNDGVPGTPSDESISTLIERAWEWARHGGMHGTSKALTERHEQLLSQVRAMADEHAAAQHRGPLHLIDRIGEFARTLHRDEEGLEAYLHDFATTAELGMAMARGVVADGLIDEGFGTVNDEELTDWLTRHGASPGTLAANPLLNAFYQLCFAYEDGRRDRRCVAAGKAVQAFVRILLTYQGAAIWRMQAGMGDTIFAPMYEVLSERGVHFEFFSHVTGMGCSTDGKRLERIDTVAQATTPGGYAPLVDVAGLPCWPCEPLWDQLEGGERLRTSGVDFELDANPDGVPSRSLRIGDDFDQVVLAIPPGALTPIADELCQASPRFAVALGAARTVATQALQLWLRADAEQLGCTLNSGEIAGSYEPPLDTYADMSHLIAREAWRTGDDVRHVAYFCGTMDEALARSQDAAEEAARAAGLDFLRRFTPTLWPGAQLPDGTFDFGLLADPLDREGEARLDAQYWRANIAGTHRYGLTPPGSVQTRLRPDEAVLENLVVAGDWTRNGISGGSVEAAVTSGRLAARGLCGHPEVVPGVDTWLTGD